MSFSKPNIPAAPTAPPPFLGETTSNMVRNRIRRRLQGLYGRRSTILTDGAATAPTQPKTLLGS